jgi:hypothetical protein
VADVPASNADEVADARVRVELIKIDGSIKPAIGSEGVPSALDGRRSCVRRATRRANSIIARHPKIPSRPVYAYSVCLNR